MGEYTRSASLVDRLIERASMLSPEETSDLFQARSARSLISGSETERLALRQAARVARRTGREDEYRHARETAAAAFRASVRGSVGPWLTVTGAISNAAGALVVQDVLDAKAFSMLFGPWQQAIGNLTPVGPGHTPGAWPALAEHGRRRIGTSGG